MPSGLRGVVWSLLTSGYTASLVVNGKRLPPLDVRKGFPQGGPASPILFDLFLDSLIYELEAVVGGHAFFFADDGTLVAISEEVAQRMLDVAYSWALRNGMEYNGRKSFGIPPRDVALSSVRLHVGPDPITPVRETKYLGVVRSAEGVDVEEYVRRVTTRMAACLRGLQGAGSGWRPLVRRHVYRTVCASISVYADPLVHFWSARKVSVDEGRRRKDALQASADHHRSAIGWIIHTDNKGLAGLAESMTALPRPSVRLPHLAFGLALHLRDAPSQNPTRTILADPDLPRSPSDVLHLLRDDRLLEQFDVDSVAHTAAYPDAPPLTRGTFVRHLVLDHLESGTGLLGRYIHRHSRGKSGADRVLGIADPADRKRAMDYRRGQFGLWWKCLQCGAKATRGHYEHNLGRVGLQSEEGPVSGDEEAELRKVEERECGARREGTRGVIDYALGNGRWGEVGVYTLREEERRMRAMGDGGTVVTLRRPENFWVVALGRPVQGG